MQSNIFKKNFETLIAQLKVITKHIIVFGDFNIDTSSAKYMVSCHKETLLSHQLSVKNTAPTRVTHHSSKCIDHLIGRIDSDSSVDTIQYASSDHYASPGDFPRTTGAISADETQNFQFKNFDNEQSLLIFLFILYQKFKILIHFQ